VPSRLAQPIQNLQPAFVGQRPQRQLKIHIDT
jgi:hypothetical protein